MGEEKGYYVMCISFNLLNTTSSLLTSSTHCPVQKRQLLFFLPRNAFQCYHLWSHSLSSTFSASTMYYQASDFYLKLLHLKLNVFFLEVILSFLSKTSALLSSFPLTCKTPLPPTFNVHMLAPTAQVPGVSVLEFCTYFCVYG